MCLLAAAGSTDAKRFFQHVVQRLAALGYADHAGLDASQVEQVVDEPLQPIGLVADHAEKFAARGLVVGVAVDQQLGIGFDAGQRRFHFVAKGRYELGVALLDGFLSADVAEHGDGPLRFGDGLAAATVVQRNVAGRDVVPARRAVGPGDFDFKVPLSKGLAAASFRQQLHQLLAVQQLFQSTVFGAAGLQLQLKELFGAGVGQDQLVVAVHRDDRIGDAGQDRLNALHARFVAANPDFLRGARLLQILQTRGLLAQRVAHAHRQVMPGTADRNRRQFSDAGIAHQGMLVQTAQTFDMALGRALSVAVRVLRTIPGPRRPR